ncbi:threonine aldolase family protein [Marinomonas transparens]|uniref:L-threonine aldolase n=1 Tax=Marinomonas transparens TaxID=2795388 RepID=A0A934N3B3_9GAMM|nr:low specificity L-threonine aldolase [Marinomonas transparens]MBJ7538793.1 low specificity L-threonine aldolase [Marinomonas transparens]
MKVAFTSDNIAGASESVWQAMMEASQGDAMPYGSDEYTTQVTRMLSELFECEVDVFMVSTGTAANVLSISAMTPVWGSVLCHKESHLLCDESTAPEFYTGGARFVGIGGADAKMDPALLERVINQKVGDVHSCQPSAVSISQVTEVGSVYSLEEIHAVTGVAKAAGLPVHMDGARFANALLALGCTPAQMTWKAGVDIVSFGATKNGTMSAEAIVVFNKALAKDLAFRRKRGGHLLSKMRLLSSQMIAYLTDELWRTNAEQANAMMALMQAGLQTVPGITINTPAQANMLFCTLPEGMADYLLAEGFAFYTGRWEKGVVRLVTSFRTPKEGVEAFVESARQFAQQQGL